MLPEALSVASTVPSDTLGKAIEGIFAGLTKQVKIGYAKFFEDFEGYCSYMLEKSSKVRTLYSKTKPLNLEDVYVQTKFSNGNLTKCSDSEVLRKFTSGQRIIVKGNGGSGKTFFLKWLWLNCFRQSNGKIPIFVELRRLNDVGSLDIFTFCRAELQAPNLFDASTFEALCVAGKFNFIFDGFDEVAREKRRAVERQVIDLSERYRKCGVLVSGRDDDRYASWGSFEVLNVSPLELKDVKHLLDKIPFDKKVKKKFTGNLNAEFYQRHRSFLSSPLLAIMMLMTFSDNAIIPERLSTFYDHAFQTLLTWHDATKDSFDRDRSLSIDDFRRVFATFCLISYYEQSYDFDESSLRRYISLALRYHSIEGKIDDVKLDVCESVNLLQKDGLKYVFVHRSFQEYFAADCAMRTISGKASDFLSSFAKRSRDSTFLLCYEIHPELVIDEYFVPGADQIEKSGLMSRISAQSSCVTSLGIILSGAIAAVESQRFAYFGYYEVKSAFDREFSILDNLILVNGEHATRNNPIFFIARVLQEHIQRRLASSGLLPVKGIQVMARCVLESSGVKVTLANHGPVKMDAKSLNVIKKIFSECVREASADLDAKTKEYLSKCAQLIERMKESRQKKAISIEKLLGIT